MVLNFGGTAAQIAGLQLPGLCGKQLPNLDGHVC